MADRGWPAEGDVVGFTPIIELARRVESEANDLAKSLASYMVRYTNPEWAKNHEAEYRERVVKLFHIAHIQIDSDGAYQAAAVDERQKR